MCKLLSTYSQRFKRQGQFHLFQNLNLGKASTNDKWHLTIQWARSCQYRTCMQNFITIFHSVQEIWSFSLFQNLEHGTASTDAKCHFAIPWTRSCQYQCVCNFFYLNIPNDSNVMGFFRKLARDKFFSSLSVDCLLGSYKLSHLLECNNDFSITNKILCLYILL